MASTRGLGPRSLGSSPNAPTKVKLTRKSTSGGFFSFRNYLKTELTVLLKNARKHNVLLAFPELAFVFNTK